MVQRKASLRYRRSGQRCSQQHCCRPAPAGVPAALTTTTSLPCSCPVMPPTSGPTSSSSSASGLRGNLPPAVATLASSAMHVTPGCEATARRTSSRGVAWVTLPGCSLAASLARSVPPMAKSLCGSSVVRQRQQHVKSERGGGGGGAGDLGPTAARARRWRPGCGLPGASTSPTASSQLPLQRGAPGSGLGASDGAGRRRASAAVPGARLRDRGGASGGRATAPRARKAARQRARSLTPRGRAVH